MYPSGIIYRSGKSSKSGEVILKLSLAKRIGFHLLRGFGAGLVAFAFVGIIFSFWPILKEEVAFRLGSKNQAKIDSFSSLVDKSDAETLGMDPYFSIFVPKINAKAKVIPNVDAGNSTEYMWALSDGVAHARGTNFPGHGKNIFLI